MEKSKKRKLKIRFVSMKHKINHKACRDGVIFMFKKDEKRKKII